MAFKSDNIKSSFDKLQTRSSLDQCINTGISIPIFVHHICRWHIHSVVAGIYMKSSYEASFCVLRKQSWLCNQLAIMRKDKPRIECASNEEGGRFMNFPLSDVLDTPWNVVCCSSAFIQMVNRSLNQHHSMFIYATSQDDGLSIMLNDLYTRTKLRWELKPEALVAAPQGRRCVCCLERPGSSPRVVAIGGFVAAVAHHTDPWARRPVNTVRKHNCHFSQVQIEGSHVMNH